MAGHGTARTGTARCGRAGPGTTTGGQARPGTARTGRAGPGTTTPGRARPGRALPGAGRAGTARRGTDASAPGGPAMRIPRVTLAIVAASVARGALALLLARWRQDAAGG